jgi:hypothetical protein
MAIADILLSPATMYYAAVGEALPDENTVDYGDDWGGEWEKVSYTTTPLTMSHSRETYEVEVEQSTAPVKEIITKEELTFETTLAEFIAENLVLALGGSVTETVAGAGQRAMFEHEMGGESQLEEYAVGFEGQYRDSDGNVFPVRVLVYKAVITMNGQLQFSKKQESGIPIRVRAKADTTKAVGKQLMKIQKVTGYSAT